jgi:hypothetical protein
LAGVLLKITLKNIRMLLNLFTEESENVGIVVPVRIQQKVKDKQPFRWMGISFKYNSNVAVWYDKRTQRIAYFT